MPTPTKGPRLGGGPAHERLMLGNLATAVTAVELLHADGTLSTHSAASEGAKQAKVWRSPHS